MNAAEEVGAVDGDHRSPRAESPAAEAASPARRRRTIRSPPQAVHVSSALFCASFSCSHSAGPMTTARSDVIPQPVGRQTRRLEQEIERWKLVPPEGSVRHSAGPPLSPSSATSRGASCPYGVALSATIERRRQRGASRPLLRATQGDRLERLCGLPRESRTGCSRLSAKTGTGIVSRTRSPRASRIVRSMTLRPGIPGRRDQRWHRTVHAGERRKAHALPADLDDPRLAEVRDVEADRQIARARVAPPSRSRS